MNRNFKSFPLTSILKGRAAALMIAATVAIVGAAGGTVAWLVGHSAPVQNTFTASNIGVSVAETPTDDGDNNPNTNSYTMLPGATIAKDPVVTFTAGSEDAWLFVVMDESENFDSFMSYDMAEGWTALENTPGVYWRKVSKAAEDQTFDVIAGHTITVRPEVTAAMLNTLTAETCPTLTVYAVAVQQVGVDSAAQAYALAQGN